MDFIVDLIFTFYVYGFLGCICVCVLHACWQRSEEDIGSPGAELQMVVGWYEGTENETQVLWKTSCMLNHWAVCPVSVCLFVCFYYKTGSHYLALVIPISQSWPWTCDAPLTSSSRTLGLQIYTIMHCSTIYHNNGFHYISIKTFFFDMMN